MTEHELIEQLAEALIWTTGSPSFGPDGEAREGFEKLVVPAIDNYIEYMASISALPMG